MNLSGLLRPVYDETFCSWVTRCALSPNVKLISESNIEEWSSPDHRQYFNPDWLLGREFELYESQAVELARLLKLDIDEIAHFFRPRSEFLLAPASRVAYCHLCIQSDVAFKRYPSWRKSWCYSTNAYCFQHRCLLSFLGDTLVADKQWKAFCKGDAGDYLPGKRGFAHRRSHGIPANNSRAWLTLRVQSWVDKLHRTSCVILPSSSIVALSSKVRDTVALVLNLLLSPRTDRNIAGGARDQFTAARPVIVHKLMSLKERLQYGARNSVPYERMSALFFIGLIFNVYSPKEEVLLRNLVEEAEFEMPDDLKTIGLICGHHVDALELDTLRQLVAENDKDKILSNAFLKGLLPREQWQG